MGIKDVGKLSDRLELGAYGALVALGSTLILLTSSNQPYNQNEWQQIAPYDDPDLGVAVGGTRQPPLDPLLGVLVQRVVGEGHLAQRLVPMASGIGCLVVVAFLLRRLNLGYAGVVGLAFLATAPVFLRYSAYTRPYALPLFLMLLVALLGTLWLDSGRRRWLVGAAACAALLPLARVPEPTVFLAASAVVLGWAGYRRSMPRRRSWLLAGGLLLGLVTVGLFSLLSLADKTDQDSRVSLLDLDPLRAIGRVPAGASELATYVVPLHAQWFPWWPVIVVLLVAAAALRVARSTLGTLWFWFPLVLAPLVFLIAYHTVNTFPLDIRHYRIRFAIFWVPPLALVVAAVIHAFRRSERPVGRGIAVVLAVGLVVGQLPMTWRVLTENDAVDYRLAGRVVDDAVPDGAIVLYTGPSLTGRWRQPFSGESRYVPRTVSMVATQTVARGRVGQVRADEPVYLLVLDSECMTSVVCDLPGATWSGRVPGYRLVSRFDRFRLYAPELGQRGEEGVATALGSVVDSFGPRWALTDAAAAAAVMASSGRSDEASALLTQVCHDHPAPEQDDCRRKADQWGLGQLLH